MPTDPVTPGLALVQPRLEQRQRHVFTSPTGRDGLSTCGDAALGEHAADLLPAGHDIATLVRLVATDSSWGRIGIPSLIAGSVSHGLAASGR